MKSMRDVEQTLQELEAAIEKEAACQHNSLCCRPDWYGCYCQTVQSIIGEVRGSEGKRA